MRYESEILYDLMKRDGLLNPSQEQLPYESELKEKYVDEVKGAYPKVTDYRPEWMNYNLGYYIPADFPTETLVNVTSGTVNNVVPYAFKSAILSGNTLVNLMTNCKDEYVVKYHSIDDPNNIVANISMMKPNTEYTLFYKAKYRTVGEGAGTNGSLKIATSIEQGFISTGQLYTTEYMKYVYRFTTSSVVDCFVFSSTDKYFAIKECILLEGDHTEEDIPFFEGMQSVKMPVLTTSNEDGTKTNILSTSEDVELRGVGDVKDELDCLTGKVTELVGEIVLDGSEEWVLSHTKVNTSLFYSTVTRKYAKKFNNTNVGGHVNCDKFSWSSKDLVAAIDDIEGCYIAFDGNICIAIEKSKLTSNNVDGFKEYLQSNPTTVQYQLETESIKTVDLNNVNQDGIETTFRPFEGTMHIQTDGTPLKPLFNSEIPVEATTQNLASFIDLKGVERNE